MDNPLNEFKKNAEETMSKSQDDFEKQLSFISAGALGLSMLLIDKVVSNFQNAQYKSILIWSWGLFGATLIINLFSHLLVVRYNYQTVREIQEGKYDQQKAGGRNYKIRIVNVLSIVTLLFGIVLLIIFISTNI